LVLRKRWRPGRIAYRSTPGDRPRRARPLSTDSGRS